MKVSCPTCIFLRCHFFRIKSAFIVQVRVYTSIGTQAVCVLHNCAQNNMEHKEKGIFLGGENRSNVRPIIYVFILGGHHSISNK